MVFSEKSVWRHTWGFGMLVGSLLIFASLVFYWKGQPVSINQQLSSINYFFVATGIFFGVKRYRDMVLGGMISYGRALGAGVAILFMASLLFSFYTYVMLAYVDPDILVNFISIVRENFVKQGMEEKTMEQLMPLYKAITPGMFAYTEILSKTFMGLMFSLVLAGFLKRNGNLLNRQWFDKFDQKKMQ